MKQKRRILVAIPCFNCAPQISRVLSGFDASLLARLDQILVIDNHSTDDTIASVTAFLQEADGTTRRKFNIFTNDRNYNLGGSFKRAITHARNENFEYMAFLHGDAQADTRELHLFLDEIAHEPAHGGLIDAVLGARFMAGSRLIGYSKTRELANLALNALASRVTQREIPDLGSGLNLYRTAALTDEVLTGLPEHAAFDLDLLLHYVKSHAHIRFLPISWREDDQVSTVNNLKIGYQILVQLLRWRLGLRGN